MGGWLYILKCADGSYYTGSTSKLPDDRLNEHNAGVNCDYTRRRRPVKLIFAEEFSDLREAQFAERQIKGWSRAKKEALIRGDEHALRFWAKRPSARAPRNAQRNDCRYSARASS